MGRVRVGLCIISAVWMRGQGKGEGGAVHNKRCVDERSWEGGGWGCV